MSTRFKRSPLALPLAAFGCGLIFGVGLTISRMVDPAKVLGFLDLAGAWDPSLAFVMAGALAVTALGYRFVLERPSPVLEARFHVPTASRIDARLVAGAVTFGVGWGLVGFCPGPAFTALGLGLGNAAIFVVAMLAGMAAFRFAEPLLTRPAA